MLCEQWEKRGNFLWSNGEFISRTFFAGVVAKIKVFKNVYLVGSKIFYILSLSYTTSCRDLVKILILCSIFAHFNSKMSKNANVWKWPQMVLSLKSYMISWKNKHFLLLAVFENVKFENNDVLFCLFICVNHCRPS